MVAVSWRCVLTDVNRSCKMLWHFTCRWDYSYTINLNRHNSESRVWLTWNIAQLIPVQSPNIHYPPSQPPIYTFTSPSILYLHSHDLNVFSFHDNIVQVVIVKAPLINLLYLLKSIKLLHVTCSVKVTVEIKPELQWEWILETVLWDLWRSSALN